MTVARDLAEFLVHPSYRDLPAQTVEMESSRRGRYVPEDRPEDYQPTTPAGPGAGI